jgi:hypothetical protein
MNGIVSLFRFMVLVLRSKADFGLLCDMWVSAWYWDGYSLGIKLVLPELPSPSQAGIGRRLECAWGDISLVGFFDTRTRL